MTLAACASMIQYDLMAKPIVTPEHNSVLPAQAQRSEVVHRPPLILRVSDPVLFRELNVSDATRDKISLSVSIGAC